MEFYLGQIFMGGWNFAPRGSVFCDGQLMPIAQNSALFSLLGTTYGGDGRTTYGIPDLRGRAPIHQGSGPGLSPYRLGQKGGTETVTLNINQIPSHNHAPRLRGVEDDGDLTEVAGNTLANSAGDAIYRSDAPDTDLHASSVVSNNVGGSQSHNNIQPYCTISYCIATIGIYPSRS